MKLTLAYALLPLMAAAQNTSAIHTGTFAAESRTFYTKADGLPSSDVRSLRISPSGELTVGTAGGAVVRRDDAWRTAPSPATRGDATARDGRVASARASGLFLKTVSGPWTRLFPHAGDRSWAPVDVRGVAFDTQDRLWFASPQGVGCFDGKSWTLYTGADGLPYNDFTTVAAGENGVVWFGTRKGAIRFDGTHWEYRQGPRWLPHDEVRQIAVGAAGDAWIATPQGLAHIERKPLTLAEKARIFESAIDQRHRRTPYGFVHPVILKRQGDLSEWTQTDSDNDGLWTSMYGAGECFAFAATGSADARRRADAAFEALRFLSEVTQGGEHPAPKGFIARTILPTSGPDPNLHDSPEHDEQMRRTRDSQWKVMRPRWPKSADGKWYWKSDSSSDELDGHYFFYALYYDLVARDDTARERVRRHVAAVTDHLVEHNFQMVDHDGKPTRWSVFNPEELNRNRDWWQERGMNSLSILAYLKIAEHVTGDPKYAAASRYLIEKHAYDSNVMIVKSHLGAGGGNQSDDEMIFMNFYSLLKYEADPDLRRKYLLSFRNHWQNEQAEMNPLFHFLYAATTAGQSYQDAYGSVQLTQRADWLTDSVDTLRRLPLDQVDWPASNSHRIDIVRLPSGVRDPGGPAAGYRVNGKVLPADERYIGHWNHDPWRLDQGGNGRTLGDGAVFLLPYYMGLYHKFIAD